MTYFLDQASDQDEPKKKERRRARLDIVCTICTVLLCRLREFITS